jgi:hypothetical protein
MVRTLMTRSENYSTFVASKQMASGEEKSAFIQVLERNWSDESNAASIMIKAPTEVEVLNSVFILLLCKFQRDFDGQTFCFRTMISSFMVEASNILRFESAGNTSNSEKYSMDFWIFRPKETGEQVYFCPAWS